MLMKISWIRLDSSFSIKGKVVLQPRKLRMMLMKVSLKLTQPWNKRRQKKLKKIKKKTKRILMRGRLLLNVSGARREKFVKRRDVWKRRQRLISKQNKILKSNKWTWSTLHRRPGGNTWLRRTSRWPNATTIKTRVQWRVLRIYVTVSYMMTFEVEINKWCWLLDLIKIKSLTFKESIAHVAIGALLSDPALVLELVVLLCDRLIALNDRLPDLTV